MANRYMTLCSKSSGIREMQIKTIIRYHYTLITMVEIKNSDRTPPPCVTERPRTPTQPLRVGEERGAEVRGAELKAAEGGGAEQLGGPGQASGARRRWSRAGHALLTHWRLP